MADLGEVVAAIAAKRREAPARHGLLVGVNGIDGSGKGYVTGGILAEVQARGIRAIGINVDGWLNLPATRFGRDDPAEHFYKHALRFDQMFAQLVLPLKRHRRIDLVLLEGIYLLKRSYRQHLDLAVWVDCTFETALERALKRGQEGLAPRETIRAYETIYFPAQRLHFERDDPRGAADLVLANDSRLSAVASSAPAGAGRSGRCRSPGFPLATPITRRPPRTARSSRRGGGRCPPR